jgi:D-lactate dehydrogenase
MIDVAVFDTRPYDKKYLEAASASASQAISWRFHEFRLSAKTAPLAPPSQTVCVFVNDSVDRACLDILSRTGIKLIALRCAGFNNVDLAAAKSLGIPVVRVPAYSPHAVAEHAVGLLLALMRKIPRASNRVRELNFALNGLVGDEIYGKTVGIIGTGKIGRIAAQIFRGFEAKVLAYDPFPTNDWAAQFGIEYCSLQPLLTQADIISLHVPLLPETAHVLDAKTIGSMKPGAIIINTSRGKLIDTGALIAALKNGHIGGVALDVYEEEEGIFFEDLSGQVLQDDVLSRLLTFPNVLITSHQAFLTHEALTEIAQTTVTNILNCSAAKSFLPGTVL